MKIIFIEHYTFPEVSEFNDKVLRNLEFLELSWLGTSSRNLDLYTVSIDTRYAPEPDKLKVFLEDLGEYRIQDTVPNHEVLDDLLGITDSGEPCIKYGKFVFIWRPGGITVSNFEFALGNWVEFRFACEILRKLGFEIYEERRP